LNVLLCGPQRTISTSGFSHNDRQRIRFRNPIGFGGSVNAAKAYECTAGISVPVGMSTASAAQRRSGEDSEPNLFRDTHDLLEMFLLFDRVKHECRHRFAGHTETRL